MSLTESLRNESFEKIQGSLGERKREVFVLVAHHSNGLSAWQVAEKLGRPVYQVRPRLTELRKDGLLQVTGLTFHRETQRSEAIWSYRKPLPTKIDQRTGQVEFL